MKHVVWFLTILCCSALSVRAQSQTISYQGVITDVAGTPADSGTYSVTVTFYSDESGTHSLWQDTFETTVTKGVFNIALGSGKPLPASSDLDRSVWVGTRIGNMAESRPLSQLGAVPMAMNVADSSITARKISADYVSQVTVDGQRISTKGGPLNLSSGNGIQFLYDPDANEVSAAMPTAMIANSAVCWSETGNHSTSPGTNYIGTSDDSALEIHVNDGGSASGGNRRVMRFEPNSTSPNILAGWNGNQISGTNTFGSTISGGGDSTAKNIIYGPFSFIGSGRKNVVENWGEGVLVGGDSNICFSEHGFVGGGAHNVAGDTVDLAREPYTTVVGGYANSAVEDYSFVGGGQSNFAGSEHGFIGAGYANRIEFENTWSSAFSVIGGGNWNYVSSDTSTIGGGANNVVGRNANYGFIGGGGWNNIRKDGDTTLTLDLDYSTIGGGANNYITAPYCFIGGGGGVWNIDYPTSLSSMSRSSHGMLGDDEVQPHISNLAAGPWDVIGGGYQNTTWDTASSILGGALNTTDGSYSDIGGGYANDAESNYSSIGGGYFNRTYQDFTSVGGGYNNSADGLFSTIAGGSGNTISTSASTIGGGDSNSIIGTADWSVISGGRSNHIEDSSLLSFIGGGQKNSISDNVPNSVIGGGISNSISAIGFFPPSGAACFIGGGEANVIDGNGFASIPLDRPEASAIVAGDSNHVSEFGTCIGAGFKNTAIDDNDFIGAGRDNNLDEGGSSAIVSGEQNLIQVSNAQGRGSSFIGAGNNNHVESVMSGIVAGNGNIVQASPQSFIGSGEGNSITDRASDASIPGGDHLVAQSYAQTVMGFHNVPQGSTTDTASAKTHGDDHLVIVGNGVNIGGAIVPSDAFDVTYGGASIVHDFYPLNNNARTPIYGGTYQPNTIISQGDVQADANNASIAPMRTIIPTEDFNVSAVLHPHKGTYVVCIIGQNSQGVNINFKSASITATLVDTDTNFNDSTTTCGTITVSKIGFTPPPGAPPHSSCFIVRTTDPNCQPMDRPFDFKVCARP